MTLTKEQKDNLYIIIKEEVQKVRYDGGFMNILSSIWRVYEESSTGYDSRFRNLGDEIEKHYVMNTDWSDDKLFISILKIKEGDLILDFINELLNFHDGVITDDLLLKKINQNLPENIEFKKSIEGKYILTSKSKELPINNKIKFFKCRAKYNSPQVEIDTETIPNNVPNKSFLLAFNSGWNDYGYYTCYVLYFKKEDGLLDRIGVVKVMRKETQNTDDTLNDSFYYLSNEYCSLSPEVSYYEKLYELFGDNSHIYLQALRDVAVYERIHENFENDEIFRVSLLRDNIAERALREGRYIIKGRKKEDAYKFTYIYKPKYYSNNAGKINIVFQYKYNCKPYERVYGLIGENGVGKTTLLGDIIESLTDESGCGNFEGFPPIFSKVMAISYSPFDTFPTKKEISLIDYLYCGLMENSNTILSQDEQIKKLKENINEINSRKDDNLRNVWIEIMGEIFPDNIIKTFYIDGPFDKELDANSIESKCKVMSSGETIFIYSISAIIAKIRYDTLLLFDEPEQHLHPHGIMQLIRVIYKILEEFESYAIIATHSPLVIREMLSSNVYIFNRENDYLNVAKIGIESFGEDISILNDVIFMNRSESKQYEKYIEELVDDCETYKEVVSKLQNKHIELGLNVRLLIQRVIEKKKGGQA